MNEVKINMRFKNYNLLYSLFIEILMADSYQITPLKSILQNDRSAIDTIGKDLQKRGYAFVRLSPEVVKQIDECMLLAEKFFLQQSDYKKKFSKDAIFGYFGVAHKESIRFLTGTRLVEHKIPENFSKIINLIKYLDRIMYTIVLLSAPVLFPDIISEAKKLDIPLISTDNPWGMFDIAKYYNDGTRIAPNCAEHFDPGLLSISLRSTEPGLQLKDENGKWVITPNDTSIAIIWAGKAATQINSNIKPGVHRVVNPMNPGKPRISMWYEICTVAQEHTELLNSKQSFVPTFDPVKFESVTGIPMTKSGLPRESPRKPPISTFEAMTGIRPIDKKVNPIKFESTTGISMSKSGIDTSSSRYSLDSAPYSAPMVKYDSFIKLKKSDIGHSSFPSNMSSSPMFKSYNPY